MDRQTPEEMRENGGKRERERFEGERERRVNYCRVCANANLPQLYEVLKN